MGDHDAFAGDITIPALLPAVLHDEVFILVQVTDDAQRLVGSDILLVKYRQSIVGARHGSNILYPSHKHLLIG